MDRRHATPAQGLTASRQREPVSHHLTCAQSCAVSFECDAGQLVQVADVEVQLKSLHQLLPHLTDFPEVRSKDLQRPEHRLPDLGQKVTCRFSLHWWDLFFA